MGSGRIRLELLGHCDVVRFSGSLLLFAVFDVALYVIPEGCALTKPTVLTRQWSHQPRSAVFSLLLMAEVATCRHHTAERRQLYDLRR
jgi:hypothetical protein